VTLTAGIQGDIIEVVEPLGSLWCVGKLVNTNKSSGFFCTVFVQPGTMPHEGSFGVMFKAMFVAAYLAKRVINLS